MGKLAQRDVHFDLRPAHEAVAADYMPLYFEREGRRTVPFARTDNSPS